METLLLILGLTFAGNVCSHIRRQRPRCDGLQFFLLRPI
jgi:hypothetical protein